jgi:transposase-like protein
MKRNFSPFKWRHYTPDVILLCVRWYCRYQPSYRGLEEMMRERGLSVDHVTIFRWVQRYAPEIDKRMRPHLKMSGTSYRLDETYVKVGDEWKYLYRAVDQIRRCLTTLDENVRDSRYPALGHRRR